MKGQRWQDEGRGAGGRRLSDQDAELLAAERARGDKAIQAFTFTLTKSDTGPSPPAAATTGAAHARSPARRAAPPARNVQIDVFDLLADTYL